MKNLLLFILAVAAGVLYYHGKSDHDALTDAQTQNAALTEQLTKAQADLAASRMAMQRLAAQAQAVSTSALAAPPVITPARGNGGFSEPPNGGLRMDSLNGPSGLSGPSKLGGSALDRPAYKN